MAANKTDDAEKSRRLLEAAKKVKPFTTNDSAVVALVKEFIEFKKLKSQLNATQKDLRTRVESVLLAEDAGSIVTPEGEIIASAKSRSGLDQSKIPQEILDLAKKLTEYVQLDWREPGTVK